METIEKTSFLQLDVIIEFVEYLKMEFNRNINLEHCLNKYHWPENSKGLDFEETYTDFENLRNDFNISLFEHDKQKAFETCRKILIWGGVGVATKNLKRIEKLIEEEKFMDTLLSARKLIKSDKIKKDKILIPVNSGFSKIYACLYDRFVIYDSRVAARMCFMVSHCFNGENPFLLGKAAYQAKGNRDPGKVFPLLSGNDQKYFESNIKASWILEKLALENPKCNYSIEKLIFAYQTALFVLGKELPS